MLSRLAVTLLLAAVPVMGQTSTKCDPRKESCPPNPAVGSTKFDCDFTAGECKHMEAQDGIPVKYDENGARFRIEEEGNAPGLWSNKYIFYGRVEAVIKVAPGGGIITSSVLQSSDLDEIDLEWSGGDNSHFQSNYFRFGDDGTYDRGGIHDVEDTSGSFHTYVVDWTPEAMQWSVDGKTVRTVTPSDAKGKYPQSPMQIRLGTWAPTKKVGATDYTIEWAKGPADFSKGPFDAYFKSIKVVDYAGGNKPTNKDVKEYVYGDKSGSSDSIQVKMNDGSTSNGSGPDASAKSDSSSSSKASTTSTARSKAASSTSTLISTKMSSISSVSVAPTADESSTLAATAASTSKDSDHATSAATAVSASKDSGHATSASESASATPSSGGARHLVAVGGLVAAGAAYLL